MHIKRKLIPGFFILSAIGIAGLLAPGFTFAQYEYYDPYSNSSIDYFPMNPLPTYTSPSQTGDSSTSGGTSGVTTSGGTTGTTNTTTLCANKPIANPQNTRSVEVRDKSGKVFFLSPPKEELIRIMAYPEISQQIFKIIYNASGIQEGKYVVGLITVNNQCYPKYGYVQNNAVTTTETSSSITSPSVTKIVESTTVPEDATAVKLDPVTGEVFNAKTGEPINDARYDSMARKIYYRNTYSTFGTVLTDTTGYVNIDLRGISGTPLPPPSSPLKVDSYKAPIKALVKAPVKAPVVSAEDMDGDGIVDEKVPSAPSSGITDFDLLNIDIGGEELEKFRAEVSIADTTKQVTVRGWDPKKKEEIVGHPGDIKTSEGLKMYAEAVLLNDTALNGIKIKGDTIKIESREKGKLLWFIPVEISSSVSVNFNLQDSLEDRVSVRLPWWHVFVKKSYSPRVLKAELSTELNASGDKKTESQSLQDKINHVSLTLNIISNILKTKHDTVKNSISNIR